MFDYKCYIDAYDHIRDMDMIYGEPMQLILKNNTIPDGVTIIGTKESIELFMQAAMPDTSDYMLGAGFYPWSFETR